MLKPLDPSLYGIPFDPRVDARPISFAGPPVSNAPSLPRADPAWVESMRAKAGRITRALFRHRDRYLKAWVAQTGILPTDAVIVERQQLDPAGATMVQIFEVMSKEEAARRFK